MKGDNVVLLQLDGFTQREQDREPGKHPWKYEIYKSSFFKKLKSAISSKNYELLEKIEGYFSFIKRVLYFWNTIQAKIVVVESKADFLRGIFGDFLFFKYYIQHCIAFICSPSDSTVLEDAGIESRIVAPSALAVKPSP